MQFRIRNLFFFSLCLLRRVFFGPAYRIPIRIETVLIYVPSKLGDMVTATPMFRAVKETYPDSKLIVVGAPSYRELLAGNPYIDAYIDRRGIVATVRMLRRYNISFAALRGANYVGLVTLFLSSCAAIAAPEIIGGTSLQTRFYKKVRSWVISAPFHFGSYAPEEFLKLLSPIGITTTDTKKDLYFSTRASEGIDEFFTREGIVKNAFLVGIAPSCAYAVKRWGGKRFAELANYIYKQYPTSVIIVIAGKDGEAESREMIHDLSPSIRFVDTTGKLTLDELKALISRLNMFISVDTGPIYIAEAFGIPTIDIVGPMDDREQPPVGPKHRIVKVERDKGVLHITNVRNIDYKEARRQVEEITVPMVIKVFEDLYRSV